MNEQLYVSMLIALFHHHGIDITREQAEKYMKALLEAHTQENTDE